MRVAHRGSCASPDAIFGSHRGDAFRVGINLGCAFTYAQQHVFYLEISNQLFM